VAWYKSCLKWDVFCESLRNHNIARHGWGNKSCRLSWGAPIPGLVDKNFSQLCTRAQGALPTYFSQYCTIGVLVQNQNYPKLLAKTSHFPRRGIQSVLRTPPPQFTCPWSSGNRREDHQDWKEVNPLSLGVEEIESTCVLPINFRIHCFRIGRSQKQSGCYKDTIRRENTLKGSRVQVTGTSSRLLLLVLQLHCTVSFHLCTINMMLALQCGVYRGRGSSSQDN